VIPHILDYIPETPGNAIHGNGHHSADANSQERRSE